VLERLPLLAVAVVGVPAVLVAYIVGAEYSLRVLPRRWRPHVRPWLWVGPALLLVILYLVYPTLRTIWISLFEKDGTTFVGLGHYADLISDPTIQIAIRNNVSWIVLFTLGVVVFGLALAILADRVRYESQAKSAIFLPQAISFVGAGVIWKFMYDYRPPGTPQTGTLNAVLTTFGGEPVPWLVDTATNNFALIAVAVWVWVGFAMVILSAALKGIPTELLEAARVDGATEWRVFRHIVFPLLLPTIAVVSTTIIITALKAFDIVYVMTNGAFETEVMALRMYKDMLFNTPRAAAVAVMLLLVTIPVILMNLRRSARGAV
jgi:alpha-glucoside transport system permease protein